MKTLWLVVILLSLVVHPAAAQLDGWRDGCVPDAVALIQPVSGAFDYGAACDAYHACDPDEHGKVICQMVAFDTLLDACPAQDTLCEHHAALVSAAILAFDSMYSPSGNFYSVDFLDTKEAVRAGLYAFQTGNLAGARTAFESAALPLEKGGPHPMIYLALGIIASANGQPEAALENFSYVDMLDLDAPVMRYLRPPVYAAAQQPERASFDAEWLRQYVQGYPALERRIAPLTETYPLDETRLEHWLAYPLLGWGDGSGGLLTRSLLDSAPQPVTVAFYDDVPSVDGVLITNVSPLPRRENRPYTDVVLLPRSGTGYEFYRQEVGADNGFSLALSAFDDQVYLLDRRLWYFEGLSDSSSFLSPEGAPDPRLALDRCGVVSRLHPGMNATNRSHDNAYEPLVLYDAPGGSGEPYPDDVTITGPGQCLEATQWWPVKTLSGDIGWMPENEGTDYRLNPARIGEGPYPLVDLYLCAQGIAPRLAVGRPARVIAGLGVNNLRSAAQVAAPVVGELAEGAEVQVIGGPVCADGLTWWQVQSGDLSGWTVEGDGGTYWLEIVPNW